MAEVKVTNVIVIEKGGVTIELEFDEFKEVADKILGSIRQEVYQYYPYPPQITYPCYQYYPQVAYTLTSGTCRV